MGKLDFKFTVSIDGQRVRPFVLKPDRRRIAPRPDNNIIFQLAVVAIDLEVDIFINFRIFHHPAGRNAFAPFGRIAADIVVVLGWLNILGGN